MNAIFKYLGCAVMAAVLYGCTPRVPETYTDNRELPDIYPDYTEVTIPSNIAPLHFIVDEEADAYITRISYNGKNGSRTSVRSPQGFPFGATCWKQPKERLSA